jgi:3-carboxy-cis,cis-muconate cycloisomerase
MPQEHQRGIGGWQAEWETLPELARLTGGAARAVAAALGDLVVDPEQMRANLEASSGLIYAEAVATALAERVGRARAHQLVAAACRRAARERTHLKAVVAADPEIGGQLTPARLAQAFEPDRNLGSAAALVARVLGARDAGRRAPHA